MKEIFKKSYLLIAEFFIIFILFPILIYSDIINIYRFLLLAAGTLYCLIVLVIDGSFKWKRVWNEFKTTYLSKIIIRTFFISVAIYLFIKLTGAGNLFQLPDTYRNLWILLFILYPIFSVLPQEFIYRTFFFHRYKSIFHTKALLILISMISFAFMHIIYENPVAVVTTLAGGYFFSRTYSETGSLLNTVIEHSIYGYLVFLFGLGGFFIKDNTFQFLLSFLN